MSNHSFLPSDDQNPDFLGAHNPDGRLTAQFLIHPVQNNFETEKQGRPIFDDVEMVRIHVPGDQLNVIFTPVRPEHKRRFPLQWAHFQNKQDGDQRLAGKTPITEWPRVTPAQAAELQYLKFLSVEDVANASDSNLQTIGMVGGMSPYAFREAAQRFLSLATADSASSKQADELAAEKARNTALAEKVSKMEEQMSRFMQMQSLPQQDNFAAIAELEPVEVPTVKTVKGR